MDSQLSAQCSLSCVELKPSFLLCIWPEAPSAITSGESGNDRWKLQTRLNLGFCRYMTIDYCLGVGEVERADGEGEEGDGDHQGGF